MYLATERNESFSKLEIAFLNCQARAAYDLFLDLPEDDKLLLLLGDTGRLIDDETFKIFNDIGKD